MRDHVSVFLSLWLSDFFHLTLCSLFLLYSSFISGSYKVFMLHAPRGEGWSPGEEPGKTFMCQGGRGETVPFVGWPRLLMPCPALSPASCPFMAEGGQTDVRKGAKVSTQHMQL